MRSESAREPQTSRAWSPCSCCWTTLPLGDDRYMNHRVLLSSGHCPVFAHSWSPPLGQEESLYHSSYFVNVKKVVWTQWDSRSCWFQLPERVNVIMHLDISHTSINFLSGVKPNIAFLNLSGKADAKLEDMWRGKRTYKWQYQEWSWQLSLASVVLLRNIPGQKMLAPYKEMKELEHHPEISGQGE